MKSPFVWGKGGRAMTPEEVDRERELVALARSKMGDTSPVGHWTQGATRVVDALGAVLREKRTNKAEAAGLAGADERIAALLAGQGGGFGGGSYTASSSGGGSAPSGSWTPNATPSPVDVATQGMAGGMALPGQPAADPGVIGAQGGLDFGSAVMTPQEMLIEGAKRRGLDPIDVATAISYETGGKFDPTIKGPTTQWGTHEGLIQFGDPQGEKYGVDFSSPEAAWRTQLDPTNGGVWGYLEDTGVKPGMGLPEIYSAINAGAVGRMGASDANNGGAPGTVADKVAGMGPHRDKAAAFLGGTWTPNPDAGGGAVTMSTSGTGGGYGGGGTGGVDIASLLALQSDPWVAKKYGGVVDALMGQQFSRQNALWEQQQKMADPMYQAQLAELTAPKVNEYDARAAAAAQYGLQPGTPEYQRFVLAGDVAVPGGGDAPASVQEYQFYADQITQAGGVPKTFEEWKNPVKVPDAGQVFTDASDLRKEWNGNASVKAFATQAPAYGRLIAAAADPSAAGDLALIFNYMKILDPGSTVREGEFATASNAGGVGDRITATYNSLLNGERLVPEQRADFVDRGRRLYEDAEVQYGSLFDQFAGIAERNGLPVNDALIDYRYVPSEAPPPDPAAADPAAAGAVPGDDPANAPPPTNAFLSNSTIRDTAEKNGVTPEEIWQNLSPEARKKFGG